MYRDGGQTQRSGEATEGYSAGRETLKLTAYGSPMSVPRVMLSSVAETAPVTNTFSRPMSPVSTT